LAPLILTCDKLMLVGRHMSNKFLYVTYKNNCWVWHVGAIFWVSHTLKNLLILCVTPRRESLALALHFD